MQYRKIGPVIDYGTFLKRVELVNAFTSAQGRRYDVDGIKNDVLYFRRIDAGGHGWDLDLKITYKAYQELTAFESENFRQYVERRHSPARGLLLHLGLIG